MIALSFQTVHYKHCKKQEILKILRNHREKMSVRVNVRMSKIMRTLIKVGVRTYATYSSYRILIFPLSFSLAWMIRMLAKAPNNCSSLLEFKISANDNSSWAFMQIHKTCLTMREKCSYSEFFWSTFCRNQIEYWEIVQMRENTDQKNSKYGQFSRSATFWKR